jgi:mRNA interferase YafQ
MALALLTTTAFEKDLRRVEKQGKDLDKLEEIVVRLQAQQPFPPRCRSHALRGAWAGHRDCHVQPDWVLLYRVTETALILVRTGSHAKLFE